uniref:Uncharacterized protein n=1 Tax=Wolbachia endosymbiont of Oeneis ivallda TaxID=3171168 RepID=A0AAU7YLT2_9RICK
MLDFLCLKYLKDILTYPRYIPNSIKIELAELIEDVLELEGKKSVEEANDILKSKMTNKLKKDLRDTIRERYFFPSLAKAGLFLLINETPDEKIDKLKQLEKENKDLERAKEILKVKNEANKQLKEKATYIATASTGLAVGLVVYITLEHTTKLNMWLIVVIATVSAFLAGSLIMKPSSQVNETQKPQEVANESSIA